MILLDAFPIWVIFVGMVGVVLVAAEIGFRIGIWMQDRNPIPGETRITGTVVAGMLSLLAFLMAFSIGVVLNQHGDRRAMVVEEANAIGTAWLRAGFLTEPDRSSSRALLQEYTEIRLQAATDSTRMAAAVARSEQIQGELWAIMEKNVKAGNVSDVMALVIESINSVIDVHSLRLMAGERRLPTLYGLLLIGTTILSFLMVGAASSSDRKRDTDAMVIFALVFVAVLIIVVDLDRSQEGMLTVNQAAMSDLLRQMTTPGHQGQH